MFSVQYSTGIITPLDQNEFQASKCPNNSKFKNIPGGQKYPNTPILYFICGNSMLTKHQCKLAFLNFCSISASNKAFKVMIITETSIVL